MFETADDTPFWMRKTLAEMTAEEWESLCDGCGKCCLNKLRCDDTEAVFFTDVTCQLLDSHSCRCRNYPARREHVPDCVQLSPDRVAEIDWLPESCAYRRLADGRGLAWWHPLVSGDPETVHAAGVSVRGRTVSETEVPDYDLLAHIVSWPDPNR